MIRAALLCGLLLAACTPRQTAPVPKPVAHPVLEQAFHGDGVWFYPRESYELDQTGLASVYDAVRGGTTTDGEAFDNAAMAAGHQTLQLPAIVRVTNLANGRQIVVRVNDRGPATPHRVIVLTQGAAALLAIPADGTAPVRVQVDDAASQALTRQIGGDAPKLALAAAPRAGVTIETLGASSPARPMAEAETELAGTAAMPPDLAPTYTQGPISGGSLWIRAGEFSAAGYANRVRARLGPGGTVEQIRVGRSATYRVKEGPFATVTQADAALDAALRAGVTDARIVVE